MVLVGLFFCVRKCHKAMRDMELWRKSNRFLEIIKEELITRNLYSFEKYKSLDVYKAVLKNDVVDVEAFLKRYN